MIFFQKLLRHKKTKIQEKKRGNMDLSRRLQIVAQAVTVGHRVADVGTDHGYVPIYLIKTGCCEKAIAMDVNKGPLERAREHILEEGLTEQIETRLSDGLAGLSPEEADTVVIAGMGGDLICRILGRAAEFFQAGTELVLQPQSEWFKVRHLLHDNGYEITNEWFLKEDGKYYVVMKAGPVNENISRNLSYPEETDYLYGKILIERKNPVLFEYLKKERDKKKRIAAQLGEKADEPKRALRYKELSEEVEQIEKVIKKRGCRTKNSH